MLGFLLGVKGFLKSIPWQLYAVIGAGLLLIGGVVWHQTKAHSAISAAEKRGADAEAKKIEAKALEIKQKLDALNDKLSVKLKDLNDAEARRITANANDFRLRGPGKAICPRNVGVSSGSSGSVAPARNGNVTGSEMPAADSAAVPWGWLVGRAEQCDLNRSEVLTWRGWYQQTVANWPK